MTRRWKVGLVVGAGGGGAIVFGVILALTLSSPPVSDFRVPTEPKDFPEAWNVTDQGPPLEDVMTPPIQTDSGEEREAFSTAGTLTFVGDGRSFGEESYELHIVEEGATLTSFGRFWFKAFVATINITFEQSLFADAALSPEQYHVSFDAPFGFDQDIHVEIADGRAVAVNGETRTEALVEEPFLVGTFATYALVPIVFPLRQTGGTATFDLLAFGGPPGQSSGGGPARMLVEKRPPVTIRTGDSVLSVDAFRIRSGFGAGTLLAKHQEFLAFLAIGDDGSLAVYRTDYFPNGFEILSEADLPPRIP